MGEAVTLLQFASHLQEVGNDMAELNFELAEESLEIIEREFKDKVDPKGEAWHRRKKAPADGHPIHDLSGDLKRSFHVSNVSAHGFDIESTVPYAAVRQFGLSGETWPWPRGMVPLKSDGLGTWGIPYQRIVYDFLKRKLGR